MDYDGLADSIVHVISGADARHTEQNVRPFLECCYTQVQC